VSGVLTEEQLSAVKDAYTTLLAILETDRDPTVQQYCGESKWLLLAAFPELAAFDRYLAEQKS